jgi:GNAT superfamily N-acetyltransferase
LIRLLEEISMNAWPARQTIHYDGWVLRFTDSYTRRANCIVPLYVSEKDASEKITLCEKLYHSKGMRVIFKLTSASQPPELDSLLEARGYQADAHTSVQIISLAQQGKWLPSPDSSLELSPADSREWRSAFARMSRIDRSLRPIHRQILDSILVEKCFAAIRRDGAIIACGLGVLQDGLLGLYDIVVDESLRQQGYGEQIVRGLLQWGKDQGAETSYLQVMLKNAPALRLYAKTGYREEYSYWYRVRK